MAEEKIVTINRTAIVKIAPEEDEAIKKIIVEAQKALEYAVAREIKSVEDMSLAVDDLALIAGLKRALTDKQTEYTKPLTTYKAAILDTFKEMLAPIFEADLTTRSKMLAYTKELERIRDKQEEINRKRQEAAEAEMKLRGELSEPVNLVEVTPEAPKQVSTEMGTVGQRMIKKYRVVNFALLSDQYKIENSALLNKVVKAGIPEIPGVEIWSEPILTVRPQ